MSLEQNKKRKIKMASTKDIIEATDGFKMLECDGRHEFTWHRYNGYTKKEIVKIYNEEHKKNA